MTGRVSSATLGALLALSCAACADRPTGPAPRTPTTSTTSTTRPATSQPPQQLVLSTIDSRGDIDPLPTEPDGSQGVPADPTRIGWWAPGSRPGDAGSVALVGHTRSRGGGVFDRLGELRPGDPIVVRTADRTWRYTVDQVSTVSVADFDTIADEVYRTAGPPVLTIMTCGDFDGREFTSTVVVTARQLG